MSEINDEDRPDIEALRRELEQLLPLLEDGTGPDVVAGAKGARPLDDGRPRATDEIVLPRGAWGSTDYRIAIRRAIEGLTRAQQQIGELRATVADLRRTVEAQNTTIGELREEIARARSDAALAGARPTPVERESWLR